MIDNNMMFGVNGSLAGITNSLRSITSIYENSELIRRQITETIALTRLPVMESLKKLYTIESDVIKLWRSSMDILKWMQPLKDVFSDLKLCMENMLKIDYPSLNVVLCEMSERQEEWKKLSFPIIQSAVLQMKNYNMDFTMNEEDFQDCMGLDESMQMEQDITEILTSDSNDIFNKVEEKFKKWEQQHPRLAKVFGFILLYLIIPYIFTAACDKGISKLRTRLYDKPASTSNVIVVIPEKATVELQEDVKYYYKVTYYDSENDIEYEGYLSKRSIETE